MYLFFFCTQNISSQNTFNSWVDNNRWAQLLSSMQINIKGYLCFGQSSTPYIGNIFIVQFDTSGNELWKKEFNISGYYRSGILDSKKINSTSYLLAGGAKDSTGNVDNLLIKINANGDTLWSKINKDTNTFQTYVKIIKLNDNSTFVIGGNIDYYNDNNYQLIALQKVDSEGNIIWQKKYDFNPYFSSCADLIILPDRGFLICGYRWNVAAEKRDVLLIRTDSLGNLIWQRTYHKKYEDFGQNVIISKEGGFLISGIQQIYKGFSYYTDRYAAWLIKTDTLGNVEWDSIYPSDTGSTLFWKGIIQLKDSSYVINGGHDPDLVHGDLPLLTKIDRFGNIIWQHTYTRDSTKHHYFYDLQPTSDNGFIACGSTWNDSTWQDGWIVKLDSMGCPYGSDCGTTGLVVLPAPKKEHSLSIYPNPSTGRITISLPSGTFGMAASLRVYDVMGRAVLSEEYTNLNVSSLTLNLAGNPGGLYLIELQTQKHTWYGKVMLVAGIQ